MVRKLFSSFFGLNTTQFIVSLIDSIFRLIVAYSLIDLLGEDKSNQILAVLAVLFVLPFILFSMPSGQFADLMSKKKMLVFGAWAEFLFMILAYFAILYNHQVTSYLALFLIALQSAFFSPIKYAIIPEIVSKEKIAKANGQMTLFSYLAIIAGTFLASFLSDITNRNFPLVVIVCIFISFIGVISSYMIEDTSVKNPKRKVNFFFPTQIARSIKLAMNYKHLNVALFSSAFFVYIASFTQINLIPFGMESLGITDVQTGYVYLAAALGLGVGSYLVSVISADGVKLWLSVWGGFGTGISYILLYVFQYNLPISCVIFFSVGMHGGLYVVPLDAYVQYVSPGEHRGSLVSAGTFLSFVGVLFGGITLYVFGEMFKIKAAEGFLIIGTMTLIMAFIVTYMLRDRTAL